MLFVAHLVDDELLVFLNLMENLSATLLHVERTSLVFVLLHLVERVVLVGLVILWRLMHILVSWHEIRFIPDVVWRNLLNYLGGNRWTHILVRILRHALEGRIGLSVEAVRSP